MKQFSPLVLSLLIVASLSACKRDQSKAEEAAKETSTSVPAEASQPNAAPAAPAATAASSTPPIAGAPIKAFDLQSVPVTTKELPAFPYLATPTGLNPDSVHISKEVEFDRVSVMAGEELRKVEGKVLLRNFSMDELKWSSLAAHRNYETALKAMGATRVDAVHPINEQFVARNGGSESDILKKMSIRDLSAPEDAEVPGFEQWLLRTPTTNIWMSFYIYGSYVHLLTVEEKALQQVVQALPAAELSSALRKDGHVALYLNFDTDSQVIRQDSLPAVDEVVKLMQGEPGLKLRVEGHTDATGDAAHNRKLSLARAQSVVQAITGKQIAADRLSAVGKGPDQPLADNTSEAGKARNRRVELVRV